MSLKIIFFALCFVSFSIFSMEGNKLSAQNVDHGWFLTKFVEYKRAYAQRQKHDELVAHLQKKNVYSGNVNQLVRRVGIAPSSYSSRAKL
jgi:hypothetical protein